MTENPRAHGDRSRLRRGFTLTEVMLALFIFSAVMGGVYTLFIACQKLWHSTSLDCYTSNEASLAVERFVYGDGWTPGLRAAYGDTVSVVSTGSSWILRYSTPDTTNNYFSYDSSAKTFAFRPNEIGAPFHVALNVVDASVVTNSAGISFGVVIGKTEGMFSSTNELSTYVCYRN